MMKMVLFIMWSLRMKDLLLEEVSLTLTVNISSMVSLRLKDLLAEEVTLTLMEGMASMVSLRMKDLLVEKVTLTLIGNMASLVSLRVKDPLVDEVSLMGHKYHVGKLASNVLGLAVVATMELCIPCPSESCFISKVGKLLMKAICVCSFSSCDDHLCWWRCL